MSAVIEVKNLTKKFPAVRNQPGLKEWLVQLPKFAGNGNYFTALDDITFSVQKGECVGVIGKNGAGKSMNPIIRKRTENIGRGLCP